MVKRCGACEEIKPCRRLYSSFLWFIIEFSLFFSIGNNKVSNWICKDCDDYYNIRRKKYDEKERDKRLKEQKAKEKARKEFINKRDKLLRKIRK